MDPRRHAWQPFGIVPLALVLAVVCACGSSSSPSGGGDAGSTDSGGGSKPTCDPTDPTACGSGATCVAHSTGNVAGCEQVPESEVSLALGCRACTTASDCNTSGATCTQGSCRNPLGYVFRVRSTVTADDALLAARCCPTGRITCDAPDSEGDRPCKCAP